VIAIGSISEGSEVYRQSLEEIAHAYQQGGLSILCGAGISFGSPSRLPGGDELKAAMVQPMTESVRHFRLDVDLPGMERALNSRPLEQLIDSLYRVYGPSALRLLASLDISDWNPNHYYLAHLAHLNNSFRIITLNFDVLIETVLDSLECSYEVVCPLLGSRLGRTRGFKSHVTIVKPHGSLGLPGWSDRFASITTTLSEIRDKPDPRTVELFNGIAGKTSVLLIAGYRGADWDILPIVHRARLDNPHMRVVWIAYADEVVAASIQDGMRLTLEEPIERVWDVLAAFWNRATVLYGDLQNLLYHLLRAEQPSAERILPREGSPRSVASGLFLENRCATLLAAADLLQDLERTMAETLLKFLETRDEVVSNAELLQRFYNILGWWHYIARDLDKGIRLRREALRINVHGLRKRKREISSDMVSTGYQYISYAKPRLWTRKEILLAVPYLLAGFWYLRQGALFGNEQDKAFVAYYKADFVHTWALLLLLFGNQRHASVRRFLFTVVAALYRFVDSKYGNRMDREYFFLRRLEVLVLSGDRSVKEGSEEISRRLTEIADYFIITRQMDHLRNVCATKALLLFGRDPANEDVLTYMEVALVDKNGVGDTRFAGRAAALAKKDPAVEELVRMVRNSGDTRTITESAIRRYNLFLRFFYPEKFRATTAIRKDSLLEVSK